MDCVTANARLVPSLRQGWKYYSESRLAYQRHHPNEAEPKNRNISKPILWNYPDIGRWTSGNHRMCIEFAIPGEEFGWDFPPLNGRFDRDVEYYRRRYPGHTFHIATVYGLTKTPSLTCAVGDELIVILDQPLGEGTFGAAPALFLSEEANDELRWRLLEPVKVEQ